jgi:hypothetical protein
MESGALFASMPPSLFSGGRGSSGHGGGSLREKPCGGTGESGILVHRGGVLTCAAAFTGLASPAGPPGLLPSPTLFPGNSCDDIMVAFGLGSGVGASSPAGWPTGATGDFEGAAFDVTDTAHCRTSPDGEVFLQHAVSVWPIRPHLEHVLLRSGHIFF